MAESDPSVYLRPGRTTDITEQMRMFDAKKWLWLNDDEEGFKAACVKSTKGDKMIVELPNGSVSLQCLSPLALLPSIFVPLLCNGGNNF